MSMTHKEAYKTGYFYHLNFKPETMEKLENIENLNYQRKHNMNKGKIEEELKGWVEDGSFSRTRETKTKNKNKMNCYGLSNHFLLKRHRGN